MPAVEMALSNGWILGCMYCGHTIIMERKRRTWNLSSVWYVYLL